MIEDSYAHLQVTQAQCDRDDPHGDGIQGYGGPSVTIRHNTIDQDDPCPTAPIFIADESAGGSVIDNVLAGGGFTLRLLSGTYSAVTGNKIVQGRYAFGPIDVVCGTIGAWSGNATVTYDFATGTITSQVQPLACD